MTFSLSRSLTVFLHPEKRQVTCVTVKFEEKPEWIGGQISSTAKIHLKYICWQKQKKLKEKMCYFPLCCVCIGSKSNHQQTKAFRVLFFSNGQADDDEIFFCCQTESFLVFQRAFLARRRLSFFGWALRFPSTENC